MEQIIKDLWALTLTHTLYDFWIPVIVCIFGFFYMTVEDFRSDRKEREEYEANIRVPADGKYISTYVPTLKVGSIVGRAIVAFIPVINVWYALFKFLPRVSHDIRKLCEAWLDIPLVPKREVKPVAPANAT